MKKIFLVLFALLVMVQPVSAFMYEVKVLKKEEITQLTNEALAEMYTDVLIEVEASKVFHARAGFTPKEYGKYKDLLRFIVNIREEMLKRELEPPPVSEWLN
jgi:hypothetical protein